MSNEELKAVVQEAIEADLFDNSEYIMTCSDCPYYIPSLNDCEFEYCALNKNDDPEGY